MKVELTENTCIVTREDGDRKFYNGSWGDGESQLLHNVKKVLNEQGYDFIKKRMWRDGHLVDEHQQYLRERNTKGRCLSIRNGNFYIEGANVPYNREGVVRLIVDDIGQEIA